ncbi:MAG: CotH kinase family protein [Pseudomonadota bacterium]
MLRSCLSLLLVSCSHPNLASPEGPHDSPGGDSSAPDTQADSGVEHIPGSDAELWDTPPLCHVTLDCAQDIPDATKVPCQLGVQSGAGATLYAGWAGAEIRGRSSSSFPKHQYNLELWADEAGAEAVAADFWGMGGDPDWVLNGNYADRALFRNKLGYDLYRDFGGDGWAAESVLCDLTLNGTWLGIYTLGERAKRDDDRIDISDRTDGASFIVKNDDGGLGFADASYFHGQWLMVWPHQAEAGAEATAAVSARLAELHAALAGTDPEAIWSVVDLDSAVDWVILEELSRNNDAYFLSVYLWQDAGGLIHFAPWDLDLAFGGYPITACGWDGWVRYRAAAVYAFASSPTFMARLEARWAELRQGVLADEQVLARMDRYREVMGDELARNFEVWPFEDIEFCWGGDCWLCPSESWEAEQDLVREWTIEHLSWMDSNIAAYAAGP